MTSSVRPRPAGKLPRHVRVLARVSGRGLPRPVCAVAVENAIEVPADDGVALLTDHYIPLTSGPRPTLLIRSPYGRGFPWDWLYGALFAGQGFHVVIQSCRGTGGSGGEFEFMRHEGADGQAAVAWLRQQEWFSGVLGTIGSSYLGYVQWALAADPPPELRALVVQNGLHDPYALFYRGGAFALEDALTGSAAMLSMERGALRFVTAILRLQRRHRQVERTLPLIDSYPAALGGRVGFFEQWLTHPDAADPYWTELETGAGTAELAVPVSLLTGWQDICLDQTLEQYRRLRGGGREVRLVVGPWTHTSAFEKDLPVAFADALGWLRTHLCGERDSQPEQPVRVHVGGCDEWRDLPDWPPAPTLSQAWYLDAAGTLDTESPERPGSSSFHYDPAAPTPSIGGQVLNSRIAGVVRNNALEARADVLVFTRAPLTEALEVLGPVSAQLRVRGSGPHFDVFARLCDVDPRGRSRNVCDGLVRIGAAGEADAAGIDAAGGRGAATGDAADGRQITVAMSSTAYRFGAGHRLRLQISGGAHPRFARNTGTGEPPATATRLVPVEVQILHGTEQPGALSLPVVTGARPHSRSAAGPALREQSASGES
jgi:putative CocE/NonD family hydrolase